MTNRLLLLAALALVPPPALAQEHPGEGMKQAAPTAIVEGRLEGGVRVFDLAVTAEGFVPSRLKVKRGEKVRLVVTRKVERTCATEIVVDGQGIEKPLPVNQAVAVEFVAASAGEIHYHCKMGHIRGVVFVP